MKIIAPKKDLRKFRAECRAKFPKEHMAALYGHRASDGALMITRIAPFSHTSTSEDIDYAPGAVRRSKTAALRNHEEWIGTIHSHCFMQSSPTCWHLSTTDIETAIKDGESVCGLVYVYNRGRRSDLHWYIPKPLPEVAYY